MGAAITRGWDVLDTPVSADSLILQRNLDSRMAENLSPGASLGPLPPVIQVQTDFFPRTGGLDVQLGAQVVTGSGTEKELRQDFSESYRNELMHSLTMLQTAWHESGPRVINALPPIGGLRDTAPVITEADETSLGAVAGTSSPAGLTDTEDESVEVHQSPAATWTLPTAAAAAAVAAPAMAEPRSGPAPVRTVPVPPAPKAAQTSTAVSRLLSGSQTSREPKCWPSDLGSAFWKMIRVSRRAPPSRRPRARAVRLASRLPMASVR